MLIPTARQELPPATASNGEDPSTHLSARRYPQPGYRFLWLVLFINIKIHLGGLPGMAAVGSSHANPLTDKMIKFAHNCNYHLQALARMPSEWFLETQPLEEVVGAHFQTLGSQAREPQTASPCWLEGAEGGEGWRQLKGLEKQYGAPRAALEASTWEQWMGEHWTLSFLDPQAP